MASTSRAPEASGYSLQLPRNVVSLSEAAEIWEHNCPHLCPPVLARRGSAETGSTPSRNPPGPAEYIVLQTATSWFAIAASAVESMGLWLNLRQDLDGHGQGQEVPAVGPASGQGQGHTMTMISDRNSATDTQSMLSSDMSLYNNSSITSAGASTALRSNVGAALSGTAAPATTPSQSSLSGPSNRASNQRTNTFHPESPLVDAESTSGRKKDASAFATHSAPTHPIESRCVPLPDMFDDLVIAYLVDYAAISHRTPASRLKRLQPHHLNTNPGADFSTDLHGGEAQQGGSGAFNLDTLFSILNHSEVLWLTHILSAPDPDPQPEGVEPADGAPMQSRAAQHEGPKLTLTTLLVDILVLADFLQFEDLTQLLSCAAAAVFHQSVGAAAATAVSPSNGKQKEQLSYQALVDILGLAEGEHGSAVFRDESKVLQELEQRWDIAP